jgi:processive 1,2-diacylglycerol beta-glucosyltransferase
VLILTASYGSGHNAAAGSLAAVLARVGAEPIVVDHFSELVHPGFARLTRALYYTILRRAPSVWGMGYALGDWLASDSPLTLGVTRLGTARLAQRLRALAPEAVITVHATPAVAVSSLARVDANVPPHTTVVTDFVAHSQWIAHGIDRYCVAAEEVKHEFVARGIPADRIVVTGVPVRAAFGRPADPAGARAALGLGLDAPVVLAMAGAQGTLGRLPDVAAALREARRPLQGVLIAGRDDVLRAMLERVTAGSGIRVLGYVSDVRTTMAAADLLITKAGGMTLAEAIAVGVPVLTYGSLPGQERRNERFASRAGIGLVARSRRELARALDRALAEPALLAGLRERMRVLRRPHAARHIVSAVLEREVRAA